MGQGRQDKEIEKQEWVCDVTRGGQLIRSCATPPNDTQASGRSNSGSGLLWLGVSGDNCNRNCSAVLTKVDLIPLV